VFIKELELEKKARMILGVSWDAGIDEIKKAYWLLAMEYHPDRNPGDRELIERFKVISEAYEILSKNKNQRTHAILKTDTDFIREDKNKRTYLKWWREMFWI